MGFIENVADLPMLKVFIPSLVASIPHETGSYRCSCVSVFLCVCVSLCLCLCVGVSVHLGLCVSVSSCMCACVNVRFEWMLGARGLSTPASLSLAISESISFHLSCN